MMDHEMKRAHSVLTQISFKSKREKSRQQFRMSELFLYCRNSLEFYIPNIVINDLKSDAQSCVEQESVHKARCGLHSAIGDIDDVTPVRVNNCKSLYQLSHPGWHI